MEKTRLPINELVVNYSDELFRWAVYRTNNREIAQDMVQDTFLAAIKSQEAFQNKAKVKTWLFSILNNKIMDHHRKNFKEIIFRQSDLQMNAANDNMFGKPFDEYGNWKNRSNAMLWQEKEDEHLLDKAGFRQILQNCLEHLPEKWFSAVQMKYLEDKDGEQICQELGLSPSNFWQILHRSKLKLKDCIETNWDISA
ncbi:MAG: sigma-70 family RNA polymerase sigma factor [Cyclobacteriaceae bacterium]|nr:sigma-70 family RNA polymerase sigma factor [Cyclobacteriaceae bacterium]